MIVGQKFINLGSLCVLICVLIGISICSCATESTTPKFDRDNDLLLVQYDCKTDVDDLHSIAAFASIIADPPFSNISYHAVAGAYGIQEGLYVPPNDLFEAAFGNNWTDAHADIELAVEKVKEIVVTCLGNGGDIWIAEAGQSDFSALLIRSLQDGFQNPELRSRVHIVQHSNWNEESTDPLSLEFVKHNTDYQKIPDGNESENGTPGFRSPDHLDWINSIADPKLKQIWQLASDLSTKYNGKEGRYLNEAIDAGGLDFSDTSEVCWILGINDLTDSHDFFERFGLK